MAFNSYKLRIRSLANRLVSGKLIAIYRKLGWHATNLYLGRQISYDPATDIGGLLFFSGEFERKDMELCKEYISEASIVLDIGANIGLHSIYFSGLAKKGCVLAFEPSLETFSFLLNNVAHISNIVPINLAVSDEGKIADFFHTSDNAYSSLINTQRKEIVSVIKVPCMKIDDVISGLRLNCIDFIKIDVEGLEYSVLRGMVDVISNYHPVIFCEIYKGTHSNQQPDETVRFLLDRGYSAHVIRDGQLVEYERHNDTFYNYLFLPSELS